MNRVPLDRLLAAYERFGIDVDKQVIVMPGAETRRARMFTGGYNLGVQCKVNHHTAEGFGTKPANSVNYILFGKGDGFVISNFYTDDPFTTRLDFSRIWILALGGGTYTEGAGGPRGLIPSGGANRVALSDEHAGGGRPWHSAHLDLIARKNAADCSLLAELNGWHDDPFGPHRLFSHAEWSPGRKVDPSGLSTGLTWSRGGTWDGDRFRADVRATHDRLTALNVAAMQKDDDMTPIEPTTTFDTRTGLNHDDGRLKANEVYAIKVAIADQAHLRFTVVRPEADVGWMLVSSDGSFSGNAAIVNWSNGENVAYGAGPFGLKDRSRIFVKPTCDIDLKVEVLAQR